MNPKHMAALKEVCEAIINTVSECPSGAPSGAIYAALMTQGATLQQYESLMAGLVTVGKLEKRGDLYFTRFNARPA